MRRLLILVTCLLVRAAMAGDIASEATTATESIYLSKDLIKEMTASWADQYDAETGGWGSVHKFLFGTTEELALRKAWRGDPGAGKMAKTALTKALALIDPVWGGAYQYSVGGWKVPHYEKIADTQYRNLFLYALGYALFNDPKYRVFFMITVCRITYRPNALKT